MGNPKLMGIDIVVYPLCICILICVHKTVYCKESRKSSPIARQRAIPYRTKDLDAENSIIGDLLRKRVGSAAHMDPRGHGYRGPPISSQRYMSRYAGHGRIEGLKSHIDQRRKSHHAALGRVRGRISGGMINHGHQVNSHNYKGLHHGRGSVLGRHTGVHQRLWSRGYAGSHRGSNYGNAGHGVMRSGYHTPHGMHSTRYSHQHIGGHTQNAMPHKPIRHDRYGRQVMTYSTKLKKTQ